MNAALLRSSLLLVVVCGGARTATADEEAAVAAPSPRAPLVRSAHEAFFEFRDEELRFRSVFDLRSSGSPVTSLRFAIPEDVEIDGVEAPNLEGYAVDAEAYELNVSLTSRPGGQEAVTITGHIAFDPEIELDAILLPVLEPLDVERETGRLHLFAPPGLNVLVDRELAAGAVPIVARPQPMPEGLRHVVSWGYRRRPIELLVETSREPLRMTATVETEAFVRRRFVELQSRVECVIESGRTDTFRFALPAPVAEQARITPVGDVAVAQITRGEPREDGWIPFTVVTREPHGGALAFDVIYELSPANAERPIVLIAHEASADQAGVRAVQGGSGVTIEPLRVLDADPPPETGPVLRRVAGRLAVWSEGGLDVEIVSNPAGLERRSATGESAVVGPDRAPASLVAEYDYGGELLRWDVSWEPAAPPRLPVVIRSGLIEVTVPGSRSGAGRASYHCRYEVVAPEGGNVSIELPFADPRAVKSLHAYADGLPLPLVPDGAAADESSTQFQIDLTAAPPETGEVLALAVVFDVQRDAPLFRGFGGRLELPLPQIGGRNAVIQNLEAVVRVPEGVALVGTPLGFEPGESVAAAASAEQPGGLMPPAGGCSYVYRRASSDHLLVVNWWNMRVATWVLSGIVFLAALVLRPTSWRNRLTVVLWMSFAVAMLGVAVPDAVAHGAYAARFGMMAGLLLWVVGRLPGRARSESAGPAQPAAAPEQPPAHVPMRAGAA